MLHILVALSILLLIASLLLLACILVNFKIKLDREKMSVFECGFDLLSDLRLPFSLNFYFVTIVFLVFDVELVLILPFVFNLKLNLVNTAMLLLSLFFAIIILGLVYEWVAGLLNWLI